MSDLLSKIEQARIIAVITVGDVRLAVPLARTLYEAGITAVELTLRTDSALECLKAVKREVPEMLLCAGTVLRVDQVEAVVEAGVDFAVAPGCNPRVLQAARQAGLFFGPGVATASEIEIALENDCRLLKYFPAETSGGLQHLRVLTSPFLHLSPRFIPLGGLTLQNFIGYLRSPLIAAVGGSWIAAPDLIGKADWQTIGSNARQAVARLEELNVPA